MTNTVTYEDYISKEIHIGDMTLQQVFKRNNIHDMSDLQKVMDAVEKALADLSNKKLCECG